MEGVDGLKGLWVIVVTLFGSLDRPAVLYLSVTLPISLTHYSLRVLTMYFHFQAVEREGFSFQRVTMHIVTEEVDVYSNKQCKFRTSRIPSSHEVISITLRRYLD